MDHKTLCVSRVDVSTEGFDSLTIPVYRASTIRYRDAKSFASRFERGPDDYVYGLYGTPTHRFLEKKMTELERGTRTVLAPSGQAAVTCAMLAVLRSGERVLLPDTVYGPVRDFAGNELAALGVKPVFYDPCDLTAVRRELEVPTRLVWLESPGSVTMEMQDLPAIAEMAHSRGALVGCDNSWASPLNFKPLDHGADIVIEALSKHLCGHSDVLMGSVTVRNADLGLGLKAFMGRMGINVSADDCVLVSRGIETLAVRLAHTSQNAMVLARWLNEQPLVARVLHPALPDDPGHSIWRRDFSGGCGVFSFELVPPACDYIMPALDTLRHFSTGASWGGTKSLLAPVSVEALRTVKPWSGADYLLRVSVGLEALSDLMADLSRFFGVLEGRSAGESSNRNMIG